MKPDYFILIIIFLATNAIRMTYELLKKADTVNPKNTSVFTFILVVMCFLWTSWFAMCPEDPVRLKLPDLVRWAGLGIFVVGLVLAFGALFQLRGVENINHLVTTGLFSRLRHPMYLGFILWIFGWAIYNGATVSLIAGLVAIGNIVWWRHLEDEHLAKTYGNKYLIYREKTWL